MEMMRSSILGKEFVNYRKTTMTYDRQQFSHKVRGEGLGNVPIVVDSVDSELSRALATVKHHRSNTRYGVEIVKHMDQPLSSVMREIKVILLQRDKEELINDLVLGLEDGTIPDQETELGKLYKKHRNKEDKILYLLLSKERSTYSYILSILKYLSESVWNMLSSGWGGRNATV